MSNEAPSPSPTPTPAATQPPPPRRRRRWFLRLFVLLLVLLVVVGGLLVAVQWALQNTDYARRIALPIVERQLGLRLHAKGLKVSLFGHTELTDVGVGLPLDKADFLQVKSIHVKHANLLQIIIDRAVTLDDVRIDQPDVDVVQDANGDWNLLQVADILGRLGGSNTAQPTPTSGGVPKLPAVHLVDGNLNVADNKGHVAKVYPLNVEGQPQDLLVWKYSLDAGPRDAEVLKVGGVVAPGGSWTHVVSAAVGNLDPLAQAFGVPSTYGANVAAQWSGQLVDGKVAGKLTLQKVAATAVPTLGDVTVTGAVDVATGGPSPAPAAGVGVVPGPAPLVTLSPSNLQVATSNATVPLLGVTTGAITYDAAGVHAKGLKVTALGGAASLDASADPKTQNVDLTAHWTGLTLAAGISQAGTLTASLRQPFPGEPVVRVELDDRGSLGGTPATAAVRGGASNAQGGGTRWDAAVQLVGQGTSWTSIDWVLAVPRLKVDNGGATYDLSGLSAAVQQRPTTIDLVNLTLPPAATAPPVATAAATTPVGRVTTGATTGAAGTTGGGSRSDTAVPVAAKTATSGGSPFGLSFASSAHVTLPDATAKPPRPLSWRTSVTAGLTATYQGTPVPVTVSLAADGDDTLYNLRRFAVSAADANLSLDGAYDTSNPKPVSLHVALTQTPRLTPDAPIQGTFGGEFKIVGLLFDVDPGTADAADAAATQPSATRPSATRPLVLPPLPLATTEPPSTQPVGTTVAAVAVATTAPAAATQPTAKHRRFRPYLTTTGDLRTSELVVFGKPIGDMDIKVAGDVQTPHPPKTDNGPAAADAPPPPSHVVAEIHSTDFYLFQAPWDLRVDYPNPDGAAEVNLSTKNLPLDVLAKAATGSMSSPVAGQLASAHWKVVATGLGLGDLTLSSEYHLTDLSAGGLTVDTVDAAASFHDGVAKLEPVTARSGTGVTHVSATYALAAPTHVRTHVDVVKWPYPLGTALGGTTEARASANVDLDVDLAAKGANGSATAAVDVLLHPTVAGQSLPQTLAHAQLAADIRGRTLALNDLSGRVLNGTFKGSAQADVDKPLEAAGRIQWRDVDAGALFPITGNDLFRDLGGVFAGTVTIAPSRDPRTLEPVRIDVNVSARDAHFRSVRLGDAQRLLMTHAIAYANIDRAVLDHSDIYLAGGIVHVWGRVGRALASQTVIVDYNGLSLDQIAHLAPGQVTGPVPGSVGGSLRAVRNGSSVTGLIGGGHATLTDADLVNVKAIRKLYDILLASAGGLQPVGRGGADFALEAGTVRLNSFKFYNRGIDAHGLLTVGPIDPENVLDARLGGQVVGTERLFKGSRLPLVSDFDQIFSAAQSNLSTINVSGTLNAPKVDQATAADIGSQLQQLVVGDAQQQQNASGQ